MARPIGFGTGSIGAALVILACVAWPARAAGEQARADAEPIGVLEVATPGVSQTAGDKFEQSVEETLAGVGFRVVRSSTVQQQLVGTNYVAGCTFGPCMKEVLARTGLRRVLVARIQGAGQSYSVVVSLIDTRNGNLVSQVAQSCPVCTVEEAISTATLVVVELVTSGAGAASSSPDPVAARLVAASAMPEAVQAPDLRLERRGRQARRAGWLLVAGGA